MGLGGLLPSLAFVDIPDTFYVYTGGIQDPAELMISVGNGWF